MNCVVVNYSEDTITEGCNIALRNRLYVSGWQLNGKLKKAREDCSGEVSIVFVAGIPTAVAFVDKYSHVMTFCRKKERRKGYGSLALNSLNWKGSLNGSYGLECSKDFYEKNKVRYVG